MLRQREGRGGRAWARMGFPSHLFILIKSMTISHVWETVMFGAAFLILQDRLRFLRLGATPRLGPSRRGFPSRPRRPGPSGRGRTRRESWRRSAARVRSPREAARSETLRLPEPRPREPRGRRRLRSARGRAAAVRGETRDGRGPVNSRHAGGRGPANVVPSPRDSRVPAASSGTSPLLTDAQLAPRVAGSRGRPRDLATSRPDRSVRGCVRPGGGSGRRRPGCDRRPVDRVPCAGPRLL